MKRSREFGFTLLELLVAVTVSTILLTIGIPSFMRMVAENQRVSHTSDVYSALNFARSEAIARNIQVVICKSKNQSTCSSVGNWADGWVIYANADNVIDGAEPDTPTDVILQTHDKIKQFELTSSALPDRVVYLSSGRAVTTGDFLLCPDDADIGGRRVQITSTGRPRIATASCPGDGS